MNPAFSKSWIFFFSVKLKKLISPCPVRSYSSFSAKPKKPKGDTKGQMMMQFKISFSLSWNFIQPCLYFNFSLESAEKFRKGTAQMYSGMGSGSPFPPLLSFGKGRYTLLSECQDFLSWSPGMHWKIMHVLYIINTGTIFLAQS